MKTQQVAVRMPLDLIRAIDAYAKKQSKNHGIRWTRADVIRALLNRALAP